MSESRHFESLVDTPDGVSTFDLGCSYGSFIYKFARRWYRSNVRYALLACNNWSGWLRVAHRSLCTLRYTFLGGLGVIWGWGLLDVEVRFDSEGRLSHGLVFDLTLLSCFLRSLKRAIVN